MSLPAGISPPNVDGFLKKEYLYRFSIDTWVEDEVLKKYTFPTEIVPISCNEGNALLEYHARIYNKHDVTPEPSLNNLAKRLDTAISNLGGAAFVKMNHRSPKDVAVFKDNEKGKSLLDARLAKINPKNECAQTAAWIKSVLDSLKVINGQEAIFLLARSFRVSTDLNSDVEYPDFFKSKIVVRKFVPINPAFEFRAFVSKGKLTALSQYESGIYFEELVNKSEEVKERLVKFWESVQSRIQLDEYVIDFCMLPTGEIWIVELNPFHAHTSACMFTWKEDRDIIINGPFTFRYLKSTPVNATSILPPFWNRYIREYYERAERKFNIQLVCAGAAAVIMGIVFYKYKLSR